MADEKLVETRVLARIQILDQVAAVLICAPDHDARTAEVCARLASVRPRATGVACVADFFRDFAAWPRPQVASGVCASVACWAD